MNIAIITARGGSKGLPGKNIKVLAGKPLISWTIESALKADSIDDVYVTTEDAITKEVSLLSGAHVIDRPFELAGDLTPSDIVIEHAIKELQKRIRLESICLLQPTSPLRSGKNIDEAYYLHCSKHANLTISVYEPRIQPLKAFKLTEDGELEGLFSKEAPYQRRQDLPKVLYPNGAIYWFDCEEFLKNSTFPKSKIIGYEMSAWHSLDIDNLEDFELAEKRIREI